MGSFFLYNTAQICWWIKTEFMLNMWIYWMSFGLFGVWEFFFNVKTTPCEPPKNSSSIELYSFWGLAVKNRHFDNQARGYGRHLCEFIPKKLIIAKLSTVLIQWELGRVQTNAYNTHSLFNSHGDKIKLILRADLKRIFN